MFAGQKKALDSSGTIVKASSKPLCGCWGLNSVLLEEQPVLLTMNHLSSLPFFLSVIQASAGL